MARLNKTQRLALLGGTIVTLAVVALIASHWSLWWSLRSLSQGTPSTAVEPSPLSGGTVQIAGGDSFSAWGWTFPLPGLKIVSQGGGQDWKALDLSDGTRLTVFKPAASGTRQAGPRDITDYGQLRAALEANPRNVSFWSSRGTLQRDQLLLGRKAAVAGSARAIHPLAFGQLRGFEFSGVGAANAQRLELFDGQGRKLSILLKPGSAASQGWIDTLVGSIQPPA